MTLMESANATPSTSEWPCLKGYTGIRLQWRTLVCGLAPNLTGTLRKLRPLAFPVVLTLLAMGLLVYGITNDTRPHFLTEISYLSLIELLVVTLAACVSTFSFHRSTRAIESQILQASKHSKGSNDWYTLVFSRLCEQAFLVINVILFLIAIFSLLRPFVHLAAITAIYWAFALNNYVQSRLGFNLDYPTDDVFTRVLDLQHWLKSENMPATFGYSVVMVLLWFIVKRVPAGSEATSLISPLVPEIWRQAEVLPQIVVAFAAGVAGYHLALSTFGYLVSHRNLPSMIVTKHPEAFKRSTGLSSELDHEVQAAWAPIATTVALLVAVLLACFYSSYGH